MPSKAGTAPHACPFIASPSAVLHERTAPWVTRIAGGALFSGTAASALAAADAVALAAASVSPAAADALGSASGARIDAAPAEVVASVGALGPGRIPARRGQTTPTPKPTTAMRPTLIQLGRSELAAGAER